MPLNCAHKTINFMLYIFPSKKAFHLHWNKNHIKSKPEDQFHFVQNSTGIQNKRKSHYISIYGLTSRVGHDWATSLSLFTFMPWRRKWQPTPVFLPGEPQGRGSLIGCRLWGCIESDTTEVTQQQQKPIQVFSFFFFLLLTLSRVKCIDVLTSFYLSIQNNKYDCHVDQYPQTLRNI